MNNSNDNIKIVIIGSGISGLTAAEEIRKNSVEITILSKDEQLPYYRLSLIRLLSGEMKKESMTIHPEAWYAEKKINIRKSVIVNEIDISKNVIVLDSGEKIEYNKLIVAVGSNPFIPPIPGCGLKNVLAIRKIEDIEDLMEKLPNTKKCVCIGGGIIGIEIAGAIAKNGAKVTLVQNSERLMPTQLNQKASMKLEKFLNELGIVVKKNANVSEISGAENCEKVIFTTEESLDADMVIISAGVKPDTKLVREAGLKVERGLVINNEMQTSKENIYGAGDVTEHNGRVYGLWSVAQLQGKIAALNTLGLEAKFEGVLNTNTVKVIGIDIFSIGEITPKDEITYEFEQETTDSYMNYVLREDKIIGCILLSKNGNKGLPLKVKQAIEKGLSFPNEQFKDIESIHAKLLS
jgi:nitrite reductase (NADH) large subunit